MILEICDEKSELWMKSKNMEGSETLKFSFEVQNRTFESCLQVKTIFNNSLEVPARIPARFPYKIILVSIKSIEN